MALSVPAYVQVGRHSVAYMDEYHRRRGALVARQLALLRAMVDLRALGAVEFGADEMKAASDAESRAVVEGVRLTIRSTLVTEFLGGVSVGLVAMVVGIRLWHHTIGLRPALISVFVVAEMFNWLRRYGAEFHRRDDAAQARQLLSDVEPAVTISPSSNLLELADVSTEAPAGSVSLSLTSGSRVRITGPSGIGKSSLLEAALGLREPVSGTVRRGAHRVGFVRSDSRFLRSSLRENIDPRGHASDIEIAATIDAVGLSSDRFGDLDALLDDDSRSLSSGERVQLAFARAIVADVDLLVIDDVAGLLDTRVRSRLAALIEAREQWGVLEASHDVAVIDAADVIELRSRT
jgi:ABC-type transport system involved in cytochrome bd biosynthesis fused ATPase/permease subunit